MNRLFLTAIVAGLTGVAPCAHSAECIYSPIANKPGVETVMQDGKDQVPLPLPRMFEDCLRVLVAKGTALVQYVNGKGKQTNRTITEGKGVDPADIAPTALPVRAVGRSLIAMLTEGKEGSALGQKFFDRPAQVGAPFGDVYIPSQGLSVRFINLEPDARVRITDAATNSVLAESGASTDLVLDKSRFKAGGRYGVQVLSARGKLPPGAFEVVDAALADELDRSLQAIAQDPQLDRDTRAIARALVFEREGLSFNRESALREMRK